MGLSCSGIRYFHILMTECHYLVPLRDKYYKSCTIRKNYKTEQKKKSVTFIQFNHTHAIIVENKQSCVSAHGEHIPSNSAIAIFSFHSEFHHLFGRQLTRVLDVIQSYVTGSDILVSKMITGVRRR